MKRILASERLFDKVACAPARITAAMQRNHFPVSRLSSPEVERIMHGILGLFLATSVLALILLPFIGGVFYLCSVFLGGWLDVDNPLSDSLIWIFLFSTAITVFAYWLRAPAYCVPRLFRWMCEACGSPVSLDAATCPECQVVFEVPRNFLQRVLKQCG